ncbi:MAG: alpha/beta hydrolase [Acholeplasmataceae bacterium]|jgi:hypothetical protein|nr:alpha/beta hydrolase [Acholeplasmataceae bacterium]
MNLFDQYVQFKENHPFQKIQIDNYSLEYLSIGNGKHTLLMLIGGSMFPSEAYFLMLEELAKSHQVLLINYPKSISSLNELSDTFKKLLDKLSLSQVYLFGANHGGGIAQVFAKKYPLVVKGLILYNTIAQSNQMNKEVSEIASQLKQALHELKELRKIVSLDQIKLSLLEQIRESLGESCDLMFYEHFISLYQEQEEDSHMNLIKDFLDHYRFSRTDFIYLGSHSLIFYGHDIDPLGGTEFIEVLADLHPQAKLVFVETDRFQLMHQPKMMVEQILEFLK